MTIFQKHFVYPKRALLCSVVIVYVILSFWLGSRYPALEQKQIEGAMSSVTNYQTMWPVYAVAADSPFWGRVYYKTMNWIYANLEGMKFGLVIGGLFWVLFQTLHLPRMQSRFARAGVGLLFGAPMGVCVNCAAPLMRGLAASGSRAFAMSAMLASPVFNIVVLSMLFTLFPFYMALTKVLLSLFIILIVIPIMTGEELSFVSAERSPMVQESWLQALRGTLIEMFKKIGWVVMTSAPLMVFAGALSVILTEWIDIASVVHSVPFVAGLLLASFVAVFLPVPMAYDLVLAYSLFSAGAPMGIVMALLFGLGSFSVYTALEVGRQWSARRAIQLSAVFFGACLASGIFVQVYHQKVTLAGYTDLQAEHGLTGDSSASYQPIPMDKVPAAFGASQIIKAPGFSVEAMDLKPSGPGLDSDLFRQVPLVELGLQYVDSALRIFAEPELGAQRGLSLADLNNDGWQDLIVSRNDGVSVFLNQGGRFQRLRIPALELVKEPVLLVVAHDFNNDGLQDILLSTYGKLRIFAPKTAEYQDFNMIDFPEADGKFVTSVAAHDVNNDGTLDLFLGVSGSGQFFKQKNSRENSNLFYVSGPQGQWQVVEMNTAVGETLAALFTDIDGDYKPELLVANDFGLPSLVYKVNGKAPWLEPLIHPDLTHFPGSGMAVDSADLSGNGNLDFFISGAWSSRNRSAVSRLDELCPKASEYGSQICRERTQFFTLFNPNSKRSHNISECDQFKSSERAECRSVLKLWMAVAENRPKLCAGQWQNPAIGQICQHALAANNPWPGPVIGKSFMGLSELYRRTNTGWKRSASDNSIAATGWSWEAKFVDYDLDSHSDLVITHGFLLPGLMAGNQLTKLYRNQGDGQLKVNDLPAFQRTALNSGFLKIDFDNDGDQDFIFVGVAEPLSVFQNQSLGQRISLQLLDQGRPAYGASIRISWTDMTGKKQSRRHEIKFAPGLMSHDGDRIVQGLGESTSIDALEIVWPDGRRQELRQSIRAGQHLIIRSQRQ